MKNIRAITICAATAAIVFAGCTSVNNLKHYDIYGTRIAMDMPIPPKPTVSVDYSNASFDNDPLTAIVSLGTNLVKSSEANKAEKKLYSALEGLYIPEYAAELTFDRIVKMLDAEMIQDLRTADIILEIEIEEYGLTAYSWGGNVSMIFEMEAGLYHPGNNELIWRRKINVEEELSPSLFGFDSIVGNVVSIAVLSELSEEELAEGFQNLTYDVMEETVHELRDDLRDTRR
ncbi:MAG: hypothetical protein PQJ61_14000 [Spirochaetales bacterium]|uniref:Lipoprotein n=1 Tax=Candidatus Thalassospirochaeta sargassi TaxID=3119039 RepID=A0AAJ1IGQ0_9SPIO|nr:hypothetical protein [Spirochaetales bacterium]